MNKTKFALRRFLFKVYAHIKYPLFMRNLFNRKSIRLLQNNPTKLNTEQKRILNDLRDTGIAVTSLEKLFPGENMLQILQSYAHKQEKSTKINQKKKFLLDYWEECPRLTLTNPFMKLAFQTRILDIVNEYMGMYSRLLSLYLQKTIPDDTSRSHSRSWHRDPQERRICKVWIYLNDIDIDSGPFVYVKNSRPGEKPYGHLFPQEPPAGSYPPREEVENKISEEDITPMLGKAGDVIFGDPTGMHYGGASTKHSRLMSTFVFAAPTYRENQSYSYDIDFKNKVREISATASFSLIPSWIKER